MAKAFIAEPSNNLANLLKNFLEKNGYQVQTFEQGADLINRLDEEIPDVVVIDGKQKDVSALSLCRKIKQDYSKIPCLLLTESLDPTGLSAFYKQGAVDFVSKPIKEEELLARISLHAEFKNDLSDGYVVGDLRLDPQTLKVTRGKREINLTPQELKLLKFLMQNKGQVLSREIILSRVWSYDQEVKSRVVDVYIGYLRNKLNKRGKKDLIKTKPGFGYVINEE